MLAFSPHHHRHEKALQQADDITLQRVLARHADIPRRGLVESALAELVELHSSIDICLLIWTHGIAICIVSDRKATAHRVDESVLAGGTEIGVREVGAVSTAGLKEAKDVGGPVDEVLFGNALVVVPPQESAEKGSQGVDARDVGIMSETEMVEEVDHRPLAADRALTRADDVA